MTEWEPATDAEVAMRDALRTDDQESYFRILSGVDLLLPVSADALAGLAPLGWGTWSTGGRTHVLAFTSPSALQACLADYTGSARRVPYSELAATWPNLEWWLAVNPGLPIEGYLPAWFVAQLSRGDVRLPTRGPVRDAETSHTPEELHAAAMAANAAASWGTGDSQSGGPQSGGPLAPGTDEAAQVSGAPAPGMPQTAPSSGGAQAAPASGVPLAAPASGAPLAAPASGVPLAAPASGAPQAAPASGAPGGAPRVGPGGLPIRTPGAVLPSGLPSRVPANPTSASPAPSSPPPTSAPPRYGAAASAGTTGQPGTEHSTATRQEPHQGSPWQQPYGPLPVRTPMANTPPLPSHIAQAGDASGEPPVRGTAQAFAGTRTTPPPYAPPTSASGSVSPPAEPRVGPPVIPGATGQDSASATRTVRPATPTGPAGAAGPAAAGLPSATGPAAAGMTSATGLAGTASPVNAVRPAGPPSSSAGAAGASTAPAGPSGVDSAGGSADVIDAEEFIPANDVERDLLTAADDGSTDRFLSTLLLATILVPVAHHSRPGSSPGESGFAFRTEEVDGERFLVVFTSRDRLAEHFAEPTRTVGVRFYELIRNWPDPAWSFAVNPGSPVGAKYPGSQVIALASWAAEAGLGADGPEPEERVMPPVPAPQKANDAAQHATVMQKTVPPDQIDYYLERGYDRVAGFVHRANELEHLRAPAELFAALGLGYDGSPHKPDATEAYVLRWPAYRPSLYRIPYGGQSEQALRAMDGWVIERPPFRGNGFAPGEGRDVIAEFKVDSVRLPHGAQLWRMDADGTEKVIAVFDADAPTWRRVGEQ